MSSNLVINPRACDTPGLSEIQFLYAVMCDSSIPVMLRIKAADYPMRTGHGNRAVVRAIQNKIGVIRRARPAPTAKVHKPPCIRLVARDGVRIAM
jgi:hypothetical protein